MEKQRGKGGSNKAKRTLAPEPGLEIIDFKFYEYLIGYLVRVPYSSSLIKFLIWVPYSGSLFGFLINFLTCLGPGMFYVPLVALKRHRLKKLQIVWKTVLCLCLPLPLPLLCITRSPARSYPGSKNKF